MLFVLLVLILSRPFVCSMAFKITDMLYTVALVSFFVAWVASRDISLKDNRVVRHALGCLVGALLVSFLFTPEKAVAVQELYKYLCAVLMFLVCASLTTNEKNKVFYAILLSGVGVSVIALYQNFFGFQNVANYVDMTQPSAPYILEYINQKRVNSPFLTPNTLGGYMAMMVPLALALWMGIALWLIVLFGVILLLTKSLGALAAFVIMLALYCSLHKKWTKVGVLGLVGTVFLVLGVFYVRAQVTQESFFPSFSMDMRLKYWMDTLAVIKDHFWVGVGPGSFYAPQAKFAHNSFLQFWAETGIWGATALLFFIGAVWAAAFRNMNDDSRRGMIISLFCASAVFLLHNLVDFTFFLPEVSLIWWAMMGLML